VIRSKAGIVLRKKIQEFVIRLSETIGKLRAKDRMFKIPSENVSVKFQMLGSSSKEKI